MAVLPELLLEPFHNEPPTAIDERDKRRSNYNLHCVSTRFSRRPKGVNDTVHVIFGQQTVGRQTNSARAAKFSAGERFICRIAIGRKNMHGPEDWTRLDTGLVEVSHDLIAIDHEA